METDRDRFTFLMLASKPMAKVRPIDRPPVAGASYALSTVFDSRFRNDRCVDECFLGVKNRRDQVCENVGDAEVGIDTDEIVAESA